MTSLTQKPALLPRGEWLVSDEILRCKPLAASARRSAPLPMSRVVCLRCKPLAASARRAPIRDIRPESQCIRRMHPVRPCRQARGLTVHCRHARTPHPGKATHNAIRVTLNALDRPEARRSTVDAIRVTRHALRDTHYALTKRASTLTAAT